VLEAFAEPDDRDPFDVCSSRRSRALMASAQPATKGPFKSISGTRSNNDTRGRRAAAGCQCPV